MKYNSTLRFDTLRVLNFCLAAVVEVVLVVVAVVVDADVVVIVVAAGVVVAADGNIYLLTKTVYFFEICED